MDETVELPEGLLPAPLVATTEARPELLDPLLDELAAEPCGHSWRSLLAELPRGPGRVAALLDAALAHRPFTLYTYVCGGQAIAIGTVAERVTAAFPHDGFPVIARCFVRPAWRGRGLYPYLVRHRLEVCKRAWGPRLRAVHLGAADRHVLSTIERLQVEPGFLYVGDEQLAVAGETWTVRDFLAPTPPFTAALSAVGLPELDRFLAEGAEGVGFRELHAAARDRDEPALRQLLELLDAIGVAR